LIVYTIDLNDWLDSYFDLSIIYD